MEPFDPKPQKPRNPSKGMAFGMLIVGFGLILLLSNFNVISDEVKHIFFSWEMLLIAIGVINLFDRSRWFGLTLIALGGTFMLLHLFNFSFSFHQIFWPSLIILMGFLLIFGRHRQVRERVINIGTDADDIIDAVSIFGGGKRMVTSQNFMGGKVTTIFGGSEINLMNSKLAEGNNILEIICLFGGTELIVPADWNIKMEVMHILGGSDDKGIRSSAIDPTRTLVIKGIVMFGGSEIKRY